MKDATVAAALEGAGEYADFAYFFQGAEYRRYRWSANAADPSGTQPMSAWNLPSGFAPQGIDAALNGEGTYAGKAYFFAGNSYVRYDWATGKVDEGFPQPLSAWNLPGAFADGIDAALNGRGEYAGKCFFFRGDAYVRYDWATGQVDEGYPQPLSTWALPSAFDAGVAACLNGAGDRAGKAYFFAGDAFLSFDWAKDAPDESGMMPLLLWGIPAQGGGASTGEGPGEPADTGTGTGTDTGGTDAGGADSGDPQAAARERIVEAARAMLEDGSIHARKRDGSGERAGWEKLREFFADAAPAYLRNPAFEERILRRNTEVGTPQGIPHWCGIFALWAVRHGAPSVGEWIPGRGIASVRGISTVRPDAVRPGDIGYIAQPYQHHFVVAAVNGDGTIDTIDGNSGSDSSVAPHTRRPIRAANGYYTAFKGAA